MDLDALLAARDSDGASGEDLEYDFDFMELQRVAAPGEERQAGNEIIAGDEPDFRDVENRAMAILERSHDLRAAVILANARLNTKGLAGFADAVAYIRRCLEEHWDTCFPMLDTDDDNDPTMRVNALALGTKASPSPMMRYLRSTPLTQSRTFGRLSLLNIQQGTAKWRCPKGKARNMTAPASTRPLPTPARKPWRPRWRRPSRCWPTSRRLTRSSGRRLRVDFSIDDMIKLMQVVVRHVGGPCGR